MAIDKTWPSAASRLRSPQGRPPRHTTYETIEDLVENAIRVHLTAAERFSRLITERLPARVRMLLQHIVRHEQDMELLLREFVVKADPSVLRTYLQYTQELHPDELLRACMPPEGVTLDEERVSAAAQDLHQYFVELFETATREAGSDDAGQFLQDLLQLERARQRQFTRVATSMRDM